MPKKRQPTGIETGGRYPPGVHPESSIDLTPDGLSTKNDEFRALLQSAATLQELVPDAVLVGGSAAVFYVGHRHSDDHDHTVADLGDQFDVVLEALESQDGWITNRTVAHKLILGELGDIEAGVRQLRRKLPLEVAEFALDNGKRLRVPTPDETLRIKAYLVVARNKTRDYLDVAALSVWMGKERAARVLSRLDVFYEDQHGGGDGFASQAAVQLADPRPTDPSNTTNLQHYKRLGRQWRDWHHVRAVCAEIANLMVTPGGEP